MAINSIMGTAVLGIQKGFQGLRRVASEIASNQKSTQTNPSDLSRSMVQMKQYANQAEASVKALKVADKIQGSLFNERA